jgi:hypothetical protein
MLNAMSSLPFWEGHIVDSVREQEDCSLLVILNECPKADALCGACRQPCSLIHERRRRQFGIVTAWTGVFGSTCPFDAWTVITVTRVLPSTSFGWTGVPG